MHPHRVQWDAAILSNRRALLELEEELRKVVKGQESLDKKLQVRSRWLAAVQCSSRWCGALGCGYAALGARAWRRSCSGDTGVEAVATKQS